MNMQKVTEAVGDVKKVSLDVAAKFSLMAFIVLLLLGVAIYFFYADKSEIATTFLALFTTYSGKWLFGVPPK